MLGVKPESPGGFVDAVPAEPIPPGGHAEVLVHQDTSGRLGLGGFRFLLSADDGLPDRRLVLTAFVQSAYDPDRPVLAGEPAPGGVVEVRLESRLVPHLSVADISGVPSFLGVAALPGPDGAVVLRATVAKDAPLGLQTGQLRLRTNVVAQPELVLPYRLAVFDDVVPDAPSIDLGSVRQGQPFAKSLAPRAAARDGRSRSPRWTAPARASRPRWGNARIPSRRAGSSRSRGRAAIRPSPSRAPSGCASPTAAR